MKKSLFILSFFLFMVSFSYGQLIETKMDTTLAAINATNEWLKLVDDGKYGESWDNAAKLFKNDVTKEKWEGVLKDVLTPLGALHSREVILTKYTTSLPGAPDGEYFFMQFKTKFTNNEKVIETVIPMKDEDGVWRVSGYFIK